LESPDWICNFTGAQEPPLWDALHSTEAGNERIAAPLRAIVEPGSSP